MNRRNFFKMVTGFVVGIFTSFVEGKKRSGTRLATKEEVDGLKTYLREHYVYWGSDSNNVESYFHLISGRYMMINISYWDTRIAEWTQNDR